MLQETRDKDINDQQTNIDYSEPTEGLESQAMRYRRRIALCEKRVTFQLDWEED